MTATPAVSDALSGLEYDALLDDPEAFEAALETAEGPIAVVGAPFAGRKRVLDRAEAALDATRERFGRSAAKERPVDDVGDWPLVVDDCQHLYDRRVGGFESLSAALDALAGTSEPVVTGWNAYAWSYLDAVRGVEDVFAHRFSVRGLPRDELASFVRSQTSSLPTFRQDEWDGDLVTMGERSFGDGAVTVPFPVVDRDRLRASFETSDDPETSVFKRLASVADGNPGVALALWERSRRDGEIRPSDIDVPTIDLDHPGAFLLRILLSEGVVDATVLAERYGTAVERRLGRLEGAGIVTRDGETVRLEPAGVPGAVELTERRRIL